MDKKNLPLYSLSDFKCQCVLTDSLSVMTQHLSQTKKILDESDFKHERDYKKLLSRLEKILEELKRQNLEHFNFRKEYTREIIDLVKVQQINVGPNQQSLQTLPYLKGKAKTKQIESIKNKKRKK